jgi:hypothetical protein
MTKLIFPVKWDWRRRYDGIRHSIIKNEYLSEGESREYNNLFGSLCFFIAVIYESTLSVQCQLSNGNEMA